MRTCLALAMASAMRCARSFAPSSSASRVRMSTEFYLAPPRYLARPGRRRSFMMGLAAPSPPAKAGEPVVPYDAGERAKLHFLDFNPDVVSDNSPVVIMHGLLGNSRNFQSWGSKLAAMTQDNRPRRILAVDMRNHGQSTHHSRMKYGDMVADVMQFLRERNFPRAILVGHSMGGKTAAMAALLHPDVVGGLVVMDIAPVSYAVVDQSSWGETQKVIDALYRLDLSKVADRRDADALLARDIVDPSLRAFAISNLEKSDAPTAAAAAAAAAAPGFRWRVNIDGIWREMAGLAQFRLNGQEVTEMGVSYAGDALFLAGAQSRYIRSAHLPAMKRLFPRYTLRTVKNAGHWIHADAPQETLDIMKMFLDREELP